MFTCESGLWLPGDGSRRTVGSLGRSSHWERSCSPRSLHRPRRSRGTDGRFPDMGRYGAPTFLLFNGGLIVGGLLGFPFAWRLWLESRNSLERVGVARYRGRRHRDDRRRDLLPRTYDPLPRETSLHGLAALTVFGVAPFAGGYTVPVRCWPAMAVSRSPVLARNRPPGCVGWAGWCPSAAQSIPGRGSPSQSSSLPSRVRRLILSLALTVYRRADSEPDVSAH